MRLVMTASAVRTTLAWEYASGLAALGCSVVPHVGTDEAPSRMPKVVRKAIRRMSPGLLCRRSNNELISICEAEKPDAVFLFKAPDIFPSTIETLRRRGLHPVVYNADHPFEFFSRGSGNALISRAVPEYELYITYSRAIRTQLAERFPDLRTAVLPFGHSVDANTYREISKEYEVNRVCFVGTPDVRRIEQIVVLRRAGLEVDVFGPLWPRVSSELSGARVCKPVHGIEMYRTLRRYRVQLNFLRPHNVNSHNMRSFEAPACGAIMLAEDTVEHREFFRPGVEAFYFSNDEELVEQARTLLALDPEEADEIRRRARARSVDQPYSYHDRAAQALEHLKALAAR